MTPHSDLLRREDGNDTTVLLSLDTGTKHRLANLILEGITLLDIFLDLTCLVEELLIVGMHGIDLCHNSVKGSGLIRVALILQIVLLRDRAVGELLQIGLGILALGTFNELSVDSSGNDGNTSLLNKLHLRMTDDISGSSLYTGRLLLSLLLLFLLLQGFHFLRLLLSLLLLGIFCLATDLGLHFCLGLFGFLFCSHNL